MLVCAEDERTPVANRAGVVAGIAERDCLLHGRLNDHCTIRPGPVVARAASNPRGILRFQRADTTEWPVCVFVTADARNFQRSKVRRDGTVQLREKPFGVLIEGRCIVFREIRWFNFRPFVVYKLDV